MTASKQIRIDQRFDILLQVIVYHFEMIVLKTPVNMTLLSNPKFGMNLKYGWSEREKKNCICLPINGKNVQHVKNLKFPKY